MTDYTPYIDWIDQQKAGMIRQVERWACINSGSYNLSGLASMCETLQEEFAILDGEMSIMACDPMPRINAVMKIIAHTPTTMAASMIKVRR